MLNIIKRDIWIYIKNGVPVLNPVLFFFVILTVYSIIPFHKDYLPGIIWIAVILSLLMNVDFMFKEDYSSGFLEQAMIHHKNFKVFILGKILAIWMVSMAPILLCLPIVAVILNFSLYPFYILFITILVSSLILYQLGAICSSLMLSLKHSNILHSIILLPLFIPIIILGAGSSLNSLHGLPCIGQIKILFVILLNLLFLTPYIVSFMLRGNFN